MIIEKSKWEKAGIWICTKCGKSIPQDQISYPPEELGENLKNELKTKLRELGKSAEVRVMTSSCLGTCPVGYQAIQYLDKSGKNEIRIFHPEKEKAEIFNWILGLSSVDKTTK